MLKTLKWIYELGYNLGKKAGREELLREQKSEALLMDQISRLKGGI